MSDVCHDIKISHGWHVPLLKLILSLPFFEHGPKICLIFRDTIRCLSLVRISTGLGRRAQFLGAAINSIWKLVEFRHEKATNEEIRGRSLKRGKVVPEVNASNERQTAPRAFDKLE